MLYRRFCQFIQQNELIVAGEPLIIGISGGPDSVVLGHLLKRWQLEHGGSFWVAHIHHGLRKEADGEAELVARLAEEWGFSFHPKRLELTRIAQERSESLQTAARRERLKFFRELAGIAGAGKVALGHQANDQAETVLFWFLRGCGPAGLAGIRPSADLGWGRLVHPLLPFWRDEVLKYLQQHQLSFAVDKSNLEPKYLRNRLRLELLPHLQAEYNPKISQHLAGLASRLREVEEYLAMQANLVYQQLALTCAPGELRVAVSALASLPPALLAVLWPKFINEIGASTQDFGASHYHELAALLNPGKSGSFCHLPGAVVVRREFDQLLFNIHYQPPDRLPAVYLDLGEPVQWGDYQFCLETAQKIAAAQKNTLYLDAAKLELPLIIRGIEAGDRISSQGRRKKVKRYLNKNRIPISERAKLPIIISGSQVVCLAGIRLADGFATTADCQEIYCLSWSAVK